MSLSDSFLFIKDASKCMVFLLVYVYAIVAPSASTSKLQSIICQLNQEFKPKDLGTLKHLLRMDVQVNGSYVHIYH